jgi:hypothetical protein
VWRIGVHSLAPHHKTFNDQVLEERGTSNPLAQIQLIAFGSADLSGAVWAAQETPHPISNQPSDYNHLILNLKQLYIRMFLFCKLLLGSYLHRVGIEPTTQ